MKLTKMIYLASPYSDLDPSVMETRRYQIEQIGAKLQEKYGYAFIHPILTSARLKDHNDNLGTAFKSWNKVDLTFISRCDELWVVCLPNWNDSIGVQAEIEFAIQYPRYNQQSADGINYYPIPETKIRYLDPNTLKFISRKQALKLNNSGVSFEKTITSTKSISNPLS